MVEVPVDSPGHSFCRTICDSGRVRRVWNCYRIVAVLAVCLLVLAVLTLAGILGGIAMVVTGLDTALRQLLDRRYEHRAGSCIYRRGITAAVLFLAVLWKVSSVGGYGDRRLRKEIVS